ncbi:MAG: hypothetical protein QXM08_03570 [Thermofilaceae archaeon]
MSELAKFKAEQLAKLNEIKHKLERKYGKRRGREIYEVLRMKIEGLNEYTLWEYLSTLMHLADEFREAEKMIPDEETVKRMLEPKKQLAKR